LVLKSCYERESAAKKLYSAMFKPFEKKEDIIQKQLICEVNIVNNAPSPLAVSLSRSALFAKYPYFTNVPYVPHITDPPAEEVKNLNNGPTFLFAFSLPREKLSKNQRP
jgi:hypothetical protein